MTLDSKRWAHGPCRLPGHAPGAPSHSAPPQPPRRPSPFVQTLPLRVAQKIRLAVGAIVLLVVAASTCGLVGLERTAEAARRSRTAAWAALETAHHHGARQLAADPRVDELGLGELVAASRRADVEAETTFHETRRAMLVLTTLAVLAGALVAWTLPRRVVEPLESLTAAFRRISQGDAHVAIPGAGRLDEFGDMAHAARALQDETARREEVLRRAHDASEELTRSNDELNAFVRSVSHDLRAPLVTTTGFLEMAREVIDHGDAERAIELLDRTAASAQRMDRLIVDLQELSNAGATRALQPVDLDEQLRSAVLDLEPQLASAGIQLEIEFGVGEVSADPTRVRQVLTNLLTNAAKYGAEARRPTIRVWSESAPSSRTLYVSDNGAGVDPRDRARIFELHERLERHRDSGAPGSGVGLALVRRAMEAMNGTVSVHETEGGGATFALQFCVPEVHCAAAPC